MSTYRYTSEGRTALKAAIAGSTYYQSARLAGGKTTGSMSVNELEEMAGHCGISTYMYSLGVYSPAAAPTVEPTVEPTVTEEPIMSTDTTADTTTTAIPSLDALVEAVMSGDFRDLETRVRGLATNYMGQAARILELEELATMGVGRVVAVPDENGNLPPLSLKALPASAVFGIKGLGSTVSVGDSASAPYVDPNFVWDEGSLSEILAHVCHPGGYGMVWLSGPAGTGKSSLAEQMAARLGRPFYRVNHTRDTEGVSLLGCTVPKAGGGVEWQDGPLVKALRDPGAVILLDEISVAGPGALAVYHSILEPNGSVVLENGERVCLDPRTIVVAADNTSGHGDTSGLYHGVGPMNRALLDRFAGIVEATWLPESVEAGMIAARAHAPLPLAAALVSFATLTRAKAHTGDLMAPLGPRRLIAWARALAGGLDVDRALSSAVLRHAPPEDAELLAQLAVASLPSAAALRALVNGKTAPVTPAPATDAGARAQSEFDAVEA